MLKRDALGCLPIHLYEAVGSLRKEVLQSIEPSEDLKASRKWK